jgi:uncharacterized surface protein with fasciclin (FAS1) repeats
MKTFLPKAFFIVMAIICITACRKKAFDEFYGRPDSLAAPIYQQLQGKGNFISLLACIDKAGYKDILSGAGYYTMFAPNDDAFKKFFTTRGITGISQLDSGTCNKIITFALVYNAFTVARLSDYQANAGWVSNTSFKRRTANYTGFYNDTPLAAQPLKALGANRNPGFVLGDNNNKYVTYFMTPYMTAQGLSATDYNFFYPASTYTGSNVGPAKVVTADIVAENGYIHETDQVLLPFASLDQYLASNSQYSEFKKLLDKYIVSFILNPDASNKYKLITGLTDNIYIKSFNGGLAFSPNNENYLKIQDNDGQSDGYTLMIPKNDVLLTYINTVLLEKYTSLDLVPTQVIIDFINAHMWTNTVWPSRFANSNNFQGESPTFTNANVIDKQICSNGFFYGLNKVQDANVFRTVYGRAYLDPAYLLMTRALDQNFRYIISIPTVKYTVLMMTDQAMKAKGFDYSTAQSAWTYTAPGTTATVVGNTARDMLQRILAQHIIKTPNGELDNLAGSGIIETLNGEYIKWNAGTFSSAGTIDSNYVVTAGSTKTSFNGRVYYANNLLNFSTNTLGNNIKKLGTTPSAATSPFNNFYQYLANASIFNATTGDITGVLLGNFHTAFIPNNAAILQAVKDGYLPGTVVGSTVTPNYAPTVFADKALVNSFILYHLMVKTTTVPGDGKNGTFETLYKNPLGDPGTVTVTNTGSTQMSVKDNKGRVANVVIANSNNLADRCVIHLMDNYLKY